MFWVTLFLWIGFTVLGELLRPKPRFDKPQPSSLGDFSVPTAEEGRAIPWLWGTCLVRGANVVWYGDLEARPIKKKVKTGLFSSTNIITGYKYYLGMDMAICHGEVDELIELRVGEKKPTYSTSTIGDVLRVALNDPELFGGSEDGKEGGVEGDVDFYYGTTTQTANDYLEDVIGKSLPGYRGISRAVFRKVYLGNTAYLKHVHFLVRRCPNGIGLTGGAENIDGDANAAAMIWEILTDQRAGLGIPSSLIDQVGMRAVGQVLATEGFGLSMLVDTPSSAADLLNEILRHIDGVLYTDPETGLITLALARADYDPEDLPLFDVSNVLECDFSRGSWAETKNTVKVSYTDRDQEFQTRVAQAQDLANIQGRGGEVSVEQVPFRGISRAETAAIAAARVLKTFSYPLGRGRLVVNRAGWRLRPGSVLRLTWDPLGISEMVLRVTKIRYGALDNGKIELDVVEDIFAVSHTAYAEPPPTEWTNPYTAPLPVADARLVEAPYQLVGEALRFVMVLAERANGIDEGFKVYTDPLGGTDFALTGNVPTWSPVGELISPLPKGAATLASLTIEGGRDIARLASVSQAEFTRGENLLQVGDELIAWKTVTDNGDGTVTLGTVWRAVLDTVPDDHAAGAKVWFLSDGVGLTAEAAYPADITLKAKLTPYNRIGVLPIGSASTLTLTTASRALKPYPPGNVKVNAIAYPSTVYGDAALTWSHRHRVDQTTGATIVAQDASSYSVAPEGNYRARIYVGASLVRTDSGVTGTGPVSFTPAERASASTNGTLAVRMELEGVNGALVSNVQETSEFIMTGLGMTLGEYLGGVQA